MDRREFVKRVFSYTLYIVASIILIYPVLRFIFFRKSQERHITFHPDEQNAPVSFKEGVFLLIKDNEVKAVSARCTHLGCTLNFDPISHEFKCPCHGSRFNLDGKRFAGPARRGLEKLPMAKEAKGDIKVTVTL